MQIQISGKRMEIGEALPVHVRERLDRDVSKYFDGDAAAQVVFTPDGNGFLTDIHVRLTSGLSLHTEGRGGDTYSAFEAAAGRLEKRLRRYKRRLKNHHDRGAAEPEAIWTARDVVFEAPAADEADEVPADTHEPVVVAEMTASVPYLTVSEAVFQLELVDSPVVVFRNRANGAVNVVYRRPDGNLGWIDPGAAPA